MSLKLIGILPLKNLNLKHKKNLKNKVYVLSQKYDFTEYSDTNPVIKYRDINAPDLFKMDFEACDLRGSMKKSLFICNCRKEWQR